MKKSLLSIALGGIALLTASFTANAQTVKEVWSYNGADILTWNASRCGTGFNGKIYATDKTNGNVVCWSNTDGKVTNSKIKTGFAAPAIAVDDAGNLILSRSWWGSSCTSLAIIPAGSTTVQNLDVTLPAGYAAGRSDIFGRAVGDVMSAEGGALIVAPQNQTKVAKIFIAKGKQDVAKSVASVGASKSKFSTETLATLLSDDPNDNSFVFKDRSQSDFIFSNDKGEFETKGFAELGFKDWKNIRTTTAGGDVVVLGGKVFSVEPIAPAYSGSFVVVDRTENKVVYTYKGGTSTSQTSNFVSFEKVSEQKAYIYQYYPKGTNEGRIAMYELTLPEPEMYVIGTSWDGGVWDCANPNGKMTLNEEGVFEVKNFQIWGVDGTTAKFFLTTKLGANKDDWATVNEERYEPTTQDYTLHSEHHTSIDVVRQNNLNIWKIEQGKYNFYFDKRTMKLSVQAATSGVETVAEEAAIRVQAGAVVVNAENALAQVYTVAGQLVEARQVAGEATIELPAGFYIVKVADTVKKVIVR